MNVGAPEIIVILAIALIIFGPKKLPEIGRSIGQGLRELRMASRDIMDTIEGRDVEEEPPTHKETNNHVADSDRNT